MYGTGDLNITYRFVPDASKVLQSRDQTLCEPRVLSGSIEDGLTMNRYAYVNGEPISCIDPFGLSADSDEMLRTAGSFIADAVPILGTVKGVQEVFTGMDYVTGQELFVRDRVATGVGTLVSFVPGEKVVGKTATKGFIDGGSWLMGKFSKQVRLARPSDLFKNGQRISPKNLYRELKKSEIGLETLDIIRNNSIRIDLDYSKQNGLYGLAIEDYRSIIYVQNTQSKKKTAQIIIHEVTHNMLNTSFYTQREEVIAHIREAKHLNPSLSIGEIRRIIKNVENLYPELSYQ